MIMMKIYKLIDSSGLGYNYLFEDNTFSISIDMFHSVFDDL